MEEVPAPETRLWILLAPSAPITPEAALDQVTAIAPRIAPSWRKGDGSLTIWPDGVHQVRTVELRLAGAEAADLIPRELGFLPAGRADVRALIIRLTVAPPVGADARPAAAISGALLTDQGAGEHGAQRWHFVGLADASRAETLRRFHRQQAADLLLGSHGAEAQQYATEIGNDLQFIERAINKVLRFKMDAHDRSALIGQLEENVKELSANYAKLNRNSGIFRDVVLEEERLVGLLRASVAELAPGAPAGRTEQVFAARLDRAEEGAESARRRERELLACLQSAQTAVTMQGMNIELLRSGELVELQKHTGELLNKGVALQTGAVLIEFVVLFAYSLHSWEIILGPSFEVVPGWVRFFAPLMFSLGVIGAAHAVADWLKEHHFPKWAWGAVAVALLSLALMATSPALFSGPGEEGKHGEEK